MATLYSPKIITDGLVLALDAANNKSYPGSGTTWKDLSGNGNDGTLTNGPTFDSGNNGSIVFDGVNDYVNFPSNFFDYTSQSTFECWTYIQSWINESSNCNDKRTYIMTVHSGFDNFIGFVTNSGNTVRFQRRDPGINYTISPSISLSLNKWYHLVGTISNPGSSYYINGILVGSLSNTVVSSNPTTFRIGWNNFNCNNSYFNGYVTNAKIYNRALTVEEVLQNYNATKSRYGL